jgi:hypothetical protein
MSIKLRARVQTKIDAIKAEISDLEDKGFRLMDSRRAQQQVIQVCNDRSMEFDSKEFSDLIERSAIAGKVDHIDRLVETRDMDLVEVKTRFVITDGDLISPAGFSAEDKVFKQNTIMIHLDSIDDLSKVPASTVDLKVYDLERQVSEASK